MPRTAVHASCECCHITWCLSKSSDSWDCTFLNLLFEAVNLAASSARKASMLWESICSASIFSYGKILLELNGIHYRESLRE